LPVEELREPNVFLEPASVLINCKVESTLEIPPIDARNAHSEPSSKQAYQGFNQSFVQASRDPGNRTMVEFDPARLPVGKPQPA
jgi:hypothetical protein